MKLPRFSLIATFLLLFLPISEVASQDDVATGAAQGASSEASASPSDNTADESEQEAEAKPEAKDKDEPKKRKTHTVEAKPLQITAEVEGIFAARESAEVILRPEEWSTFEIVEIVPHGTTVSKGEVLARFDPEKLDEAIEDLELQLRLSELALMKAEQELPRATEDVETQFEQAKRALEDARADYQRYREIDREISLRSADMSLKSTEQYVENTREELRQLEKMYEADDLTEETEEIVLKRQRAAVEQAEFNLEVSRKNHEETINIMLPRRDIREKEALERVELQFERAKTAYETDRSKQKYELEQQRESRAESVERHAKLVADRALLEIRSPADGVVYYGGATDGEWGETSSLIGSLKKHGSAPTESVMMTIVKTRPMYVIGSIGEADRPSVEVGQQACIETAADDGPKLCGKLEQLSNIHMGDKNYRVEISVDDADIADWLVPGLTAKAEITTYSNDEALLIPKSAIKSEDDDEDAKYVTLVDPEDSEAEPEKRSVELGKSKDDNVEVVEGLSVGDVVLLDDEKKSE